MKLLNDFNEKWYFIGTITGIFAGIFIGWLIYEDEKQIIFVQEETSIDTVTVVKDWSKDTSLSENKKSYYDYLYDKKDSKAYN